MKNKFIYRPDIDGLRALAVISVIIYHLKKSWLPSGFLGVDIFFVISGFLITSIIFPQIENGTFSFSDFYNRRIKRILPVFFVVLIVTLVISGYLMLPSDLYGLRNATISSLLFAANLYFSRSLEYFDISSEERPFLHIWSLSVEEQYYFIFPIFLFFLLKFSYARKHIFKFILGIFSILIAISFVNLTKIGIYLDTYYLPHLRFIEILTGSILAIFLIKYPQNHSKRVYVSLSSLSLFILIISFISENIFTPPHFPGILSLIPAVATAAFIFSNAENHFISKVFSNKILVWIGKLSYSLYLWHWVILALMRYIWQENELPLSWMVVAVILTFILSIFSYYFVENPIRKLKIPFKKSFLYFYVVPIFVILGIFFSFKNKTANIGIKKDLGHIGRDLPCYQNLDETCWLGDVSAKIKPILVIGDSHTLHLYPFIDAIGKKEGWKAVFSPANGCPYVFDYIYDETGKDSNLEYCNKRNPYFDEEYKKFNTIVISNFWSNISYINNPLFYVKIEKMLQKFIKEGKNIYLINTNDYFTFNGGRNYYLSQKGIDITQFKTEFFTKESIKNTAKVAKIAAKYPQVKWINLSDFFQKKKKDKEILTFFTDDNHLSIYGVNYLIEVFKNRRFIDEKDLEE